MYDKEVIMSYIMLAVIKLLLCKTPITFATVEATVDKLIGTYPEDSDIIEKYYELQKL